MTNPKDPHDADFRGTLPADLQDLDRELSGIRIEERPSFGPELERELIRAWRTRTWSGSRASRPWIRTLMAAGLVGLMIAGVSVPSARAAVFEFVRTVAAEVLPDLFPLEPELQLPEIEALVPVPVSPEPRTEVVVVSPVDSHEEVGTPNPDLPTISHVETTFPEIISRREAAAMIASRYPRELQEAGVEGSVKLQFWVGEEGALENIQIREGSGSQQLDYVAMRSARELKFRPATRNGVPVGTWVEVNIHFFALAGTGIIGSDSMDSGM